MLLLIQGKKRKSRSMHLVSGEGVRVERPEDVTDTRTGKKYNILKLNKSMITANLTMALSPALPRTARP